MAIPAHVGWYLLDANGEGPQFPEGVYVHEECHVHSRLKMLQSFEFFGDDDKVIHLMLQAHEDDTGVGGTRAKAGVGHTQAYRPEATPHFPEDGDLLAKSLSSIEQPDPSALAVNAARELFDGAC